MPTYKCGFEKLEVWKEARIYVSSIYNLTKKYPKEEKLGLCSQMQRAVVSVSSNIAEGVSRSSAKEQIRFVEISYGSLMEVYSQLCLSEDLGYISSEEFDVLRPTINKIAIQLSGLRNSALKRIESEK